MRKEIRQRTRLVGKLAHGDPEVKSEELSLLLGHVSPPPTPTKGARAGGEPYQPVMARIKPATPQTDPRLVKGPDLAFGSTWVTVKDVHVTEETPPMQYQDGALHRPNDHHYWRGDEWVIELES